MTRATFMSKCEGFGFCVLGGAHVNLQAGFWVRLAEPVEHIQAHTRSARSTSWGVVYDWLVARQASRAARQAAIGRQWCNPVH